MRLRQHGPRKPDLIECSVSVRDSDRRENGMQAAPIQCSARFPGRRRLELRLSCLTLAHCRRYTICAPHRSIGRKTANGACWTTSRLGRQHKEGNDVDKCQQKSRVDQRIRNQRTRRRLSRSPSGGFDHEDLEPHGTFQDTQEGRSFKARPAEAYRPATKAARLR